MNGAGLYERVSTEAQAERYGLGAQDWALKKRAEERGYTIVPDSEGDAFVDDGYSGGDLQGISRYGNIDIARIPPQHHISHKATNKI